jgi:hypothetical protein
LPVGEKTGRRTDVNTCHFGKNVRLFPSKRREKGHGTRIDAFKMKILTCNTGT